MGRKRSRRNGQKIGAPPAKKQCTELTKVEPTAIENKSMENHVTDVSTEKASWTSKLMKMICAKVKELIYEEDDYHRKKFVDKNEKCVIKFGLLIENKESMKYLLKNPVLTCDEAANFLSHWSILLDVVQKRVLCFEVAHQCICIQHIVKLSKELIIEPKKCIKVFFERLNAEDGHYREAFDDELRLFKEKILSLNEPRVAASILVIHTKTDDEESQTLDAEEVLKSLPKALRRGFKAQNVQMLKDAMRDLPKSEAKYYMQRCVDAGLWTPDGCVM